MKANSLCHRGVRATNGHLITPPSSVMKSCRLMGPSLSAGTTRYQIKAALCSTANLAPIDRSGSNSTEVVEAAPRAMSALPRKQTK
jgi:hypothetical protein